MDYLDIMAEEAVEDVFISATKIFDETKICAQNISQLLTWCITENNDLITLSKENEPVVDEEVQERKLKLSKFCESIRIEIKKWMNFIPMAARTIKLAVDCTYSLINKILDENRFSVYVPDDKNEAIVPDAYANKAKKPEEDLSQKFDSVLNFLIQLWRTISHFIKVLEELTKFNITTENDFVFYSNSVKPTLEFVKQILPNVICKSIVITKQPPLIVLRDAINRNEERGKSKTDKPTQNKELVKCQTFFDLELTLFTSNTLSHHCDPNVFSKVETILLSDSDADKLVSNTLETFPPPQSGTLVSVPQSFKCVPSSDSSLWTANFKIRVRSIVRSNEKLIENSRYCILFVFNTVQPILTLQSPFKEKDFTITLNNAFVSLPFSVIVHPSQKAPTLPGIFWYRAFGPTNRIDLNMCENPQPIAWMLFKRRLNELFYIATGAKKLSEEQLNHVATRLFGSRNGFETQIVSYEMFCKVFSHKHAVQHFASFGQNQTLFLQNFMPETVGDGKEAGFTFWDWFYSILLLIGNKKLKSYWNEGLILGFASRFTVQNLLSKYQEPMLSIKFSDNMKGTIVFCIFLPKFEEQIVYLGLDDVLMKDLSLYQCYEKLCQSHKFLSNVKRIQCGYTVGDVKHVETLARINNMELKINANQNGDRNNPLKKNGYTKTQWILCMENPALQKYLESASTVQLDGVVPQSSSSMYVSLNSPFSSLSPHDINSYNNSLQDFQYFQQTPFNKQSGSTNLSSFDESFDNILNHQVSSASSSSDVTYENEIFMDDNMFMFQNGSNNAQPFFNF